MRNRREKEAGERVGALLLLGVVILSVLSLLHPEAPAVHDELLQRGRRGHQLDGLLIFDKDQRQRFLQLSSTTTADQTKEKHEEEYDPAKDCLHVKCKGGGHAQMKWGADGEPLVGHVPENVGDTWSEYGATGIGFKGVDNHAEATNVAPCLGSRCKQLHGEKWGADGEPLAGHTPENIGDKWGEYGASGVAFPGVDQHVATKLPPCLGAKCKQLHGGKWGADGEPLDGHTPENIGDTWGEYGASGVAYQGVDQHVATKLPPCLGAKCKQLHGEKWGADGEPLDGHTPENIGDTWGKYGASGRAWKAVDEHRKLVSPFECMGKPCKLKKLSRAGNSNIGDHYSQFGALGKPYTGTGMYVDRSQPLPACLGGNASPCKDGSRPLGIKHWGLYGKPIGRHLSPHPGTEATKKEVGGPVLL